MNIYDISKAAGVSIATVSRVINGKDNVSDKTRKKVLSAIDENEFTPNVFARGLGLNSIRTIGVMCSDVLDLALAQALSVTENELRKYGYNSIVCFTGSDFENKRSTLQLLINKRVDAVVIVGSQFCMPYDNSYIASAAEKIPIIIINGFVDAPNVYCHYCDDTSIVYSVTQKLIGQHAGDLQDILYLYEYESQSGQRKKQGFLQAMAESNLLDRYQIVKCPFNIEKNTGTLTEILEKSNFSAIVTAEDHLALAALKAANRLKMDVPGKLSIVGYNNSLLALCTDPELTTIDNHLVAMSIHSVQTLIDVIGGKQAINCVITPGTLIERATTRFKSAE